MKPRLFHSIGFESEESAAVRRLIVEMGVQSQIEFSNIAYEGPQKDLRERIGVVEAPVMFVGDETLRGRAVIVDWLRKNF